MTRLDELRAMYAFIGWEIEIEESRQEATDDTCARVILRAARLYDVEPDDILSRNRHRRPMLARQAACWMLRNHVGLSLARIGNVLGVDHTTVMLACRKIDAAPSIRALLLGIEVA
jgi:chromosomal replication initiator protein